MNYQKDDSYYTKGLMIKITEKQRLMLGVMAEILGENRSKIVRRLLMAEAKRVAALIDDEEELSLWTDLINQIEKEEDYHEFVVGEAVSQGMRDAYFEKTGKVMGQDDEKNLKSLADKQRVWQRRHRAKIKMQRLKELEKEYGNTLL